MDEFRDSRVPPKLRRQVFDLCDGIDLCMNREPRMGIPALILLYAGIDGMAWVSIPDDRDEVTGDDFQDWTRSYLLPDSGLDCDEADLWAARCGLVHSQIMDSRIARQGRARHIWYHVGPGNRSFIPIHETSKQLPATISLGQLVAAFRRGTERFFERIERDSELRARVWQRAHRYFDEVRVLGSTGGSGVSVETVPSIYG